jgi:Uma2 family endonuclease
MTIIAPKAPNVPANKRLPREQAPQLVALDNVRWETYERLLRDLDGQNVRITYDRGRMVLMSPLPWHEKVKTLIGRMIELAGLELIIPISSLGSATWKRKDLARGLEADECYYVQHEHLVRRKKRIDLATDPPPDLAVEVDITHQPADRPSVYAALGVNEVWRYDGKRVEFLKLGADGIYRAIPASEAFPELTPEVINRFLGMFGTTDESSLMRAFQQFLRKSRQRKPRRGKRQ